MKLKKAEIIWLIVVVVLYALYNLPGVPKYNDPNGLFIHAVVTVIPLWISIYIGMVKIYRVFKIRDNEEDK